MLVNYFKIKNISSRGRVFALSALGGVFLLLSLWLIVHKNFTDSLIDYAPSDASFYFYFSQPKIKNLPQLDNLLTQLFKDFGINDESRLNLNRELAVVGNNSGQYCLMFKTDRPKATKKFLDSINQSYRFVSYSRVVVCDQTLAVNYVKNKKNTLAVATSGQFSWFSTANLFVSRDYIKNNNTDQLIGMLNSFLGDKNGNLILSFKAKSGGLELKNNGHLESRAEESFKVSVLPVNNTADFVLSSSDAKSLFDNWQKRLEQISADDHNLFVSSRLNKNLNQYLPSGASNIFLTAKDNGSNANWALARNDFYLVLSGVDSAGVENFLKTLVAEEYPTVKITYLSDGTAVRELRPDAEKFSFAEQNGVKVLIAPDEKAKLMYKIVDDKTVLSNNEQLLNQPLPELGLNYLKFKSALLPSSSGWKYLQGFDFLQVNRKSILISFSG